MKKLSLFLFAMLILGCGTETTVVEEPVVEEPEPIIEEPPPALMEDEHAIPEDTSPPEIVEGSVLDGDVDVDPEPLNRDGITFRFTEPLNFFLIEIYREDIMPGGVDKTLHWHPRDVFTGRFTHPKGIEQSAMIKPVAGSQLLEYNTDYMILIYVQDFACNGRETVIRFRTKPR